MTGKIKSNAKLKSLTMMIIIQVAFCTEAKCTQKLNCPLYTIKGSFISFQFVPDTLHSKISSSLQICPDQKTQICEWKKFVFALHKFLVAERRKCLSTKCLAPIEAK